MTCQVCRPVAVPPSVRSDPLQVSVKLTMTAGSICLGNVRMLVRQVPVTEPRRAGRLTGIRHARVPGVVGKMENTLRLEARATRTSSAVFLLEEFAQPAASSMVAASTPSAAAGLISIAYTPRRLRSSQFAEPGSNGLARPWPLRERTTTLPTSPTSTSTGYACAPIEFEPPSRLERRGATMQPAESCCQNVKPTSYSEVA